MKFALILVSLLLLNSSHFAQDISPTGVPHIIEEVTPLFIPTQEVPDQGPTAPALVLQIRGYQPDRCEFPVILKKTIADGWLSIEIYREIPPNVRCMGGQIPYEEMVQIPLGVSDYGDSVLEGAEAYIQVAVEINDYTGLLNFEGGAPEITRTAREDVMVSEVEVVLSEDSPEPIGLQVDGFVSYCALPIRGRVVEINQDTLKVQVYRPQPPETLRCPITIRATTYSIFVRLPEALPDGVDAYEVNGVTGALQTEAEG